MAVWADQNTGDISFLACPFVAIGKEQLKAHLPQSLLGPLCLAEVENFQEPVLFGCCVEMAMEKSGTPLIATMTMDEQSLK